MLQRVIEQARRFRLATLLSITAVCGCGGGDDVDRAALLRGGAGEQRSMPGGGGSAPAPSTCGEQPVGEASGDPFSAVGVSENSGAACCIEPLPGFTGLPTIEALPDPFVALNGSAVTARNQWTCRRAEISAQVQEYELGPKPGRPSIVTGALADGRLTVTAGEEGNTVSFDVSISRPEGAPAGPIPAVIGVGTSSLDNTVFSERGIALLTFDNSAIGAQNGSGSRGTGLFYQIYGSNHAAGSMMAWAWGLSRIIDALEATPEANIDTQRLAVTGCSRNGKGALFSGAFDERIALTIPQESGGGGSAAWRISQVQQNAVLAANPNASVDDQVETLAAAQGEPWYRASFRQFNTAVPQLPFDHHMVMGLVAPRALFVIDNTSMNWLGNESSFTDSVAAAEIWNGLGVTGTMGASQVGDHDHCQFPASQRAELAAFVDRFLLDDQSANTNVLRSDRIVPDRARWMPWSTPALP